MAGGKIDILIEPDTKGFNSKLQAGLGGSIGTAAKIGSAIGLALGGAQIGRQILQVGTDFQSTMNTMAAVSQASAAQLDEVRAKARELGSDVTLTATSASDAAAAMTELAKGGFSVEQSMQAAKGTLQLAAAAQVDAAQAATIQSQALQAFSLDASHASRVSDILAGAANASSAEMTDVALALQQSGTVAHQFGVSIDDTATALAMFANAGITGSDAGTLLKTSLLALTDQGKPAQAAIEELGLTVYDAQGKFVGLPRLIDDLNRASKNMTKEQYDAATATLFGSDAVRFAGLAAAQTSSDFTKLRDAVTRQGQASEVAAAQTEGLPGAIERFQNTYEEVLLGLFDSIQGDLVKAVDAASGALAQLGPVAAGAFSLAASAAQTTIEVLTPIAGIITEINTAVGGMGTSLSVAAIALAGLNKISINDRMVSAVDSMRSFTTSAADSYRKIGQFQQAVGDLGLKISRFDSAMALATQSQNKNISAIGRAYSNAVEPLRVYEQSQRTAAATAKQAAAASKNAFEAFDRIGAQAAHSVAASSARIAGTLKGHLVGGFTTAKLAARGFVDFLGGPWAVGIAAAGFAVVGAIDGLRRMSIAYDELQAGSQRNAEGFYTMRDAFAQGTSTLEAAQTNVQKMQQSMDQLAQNGPNWFHRGLLGIEDALQAVSGLTSEYHEQGKAIRKASDDAAAGKQVMKDLQLTQHDLAHAATGSVEAYNQLHTQLLSNGRGGEYLARQLEQLRGQFTQAQDSFERMGPAGVHAAEAIKQVSEQAGTAADRAEHLWQTFLELSGIPLTAQEASAQLTKTLDEIVQKTEDVAGAQLDAAGNIDVTAKSGVELHESLLKLGEAMVRATAAGEDSHEVFDRSAAQLEHLRQASGLGEQEWKKLLDTMMLTPEKLSVLAEIQTNTAKAELASVAAKITELNGTEATANLEIKDENARRALEEFGFKVVEVNSTSGEVELSISDSEALDRYHWWVEQGMPGLDGQSAEMTATLETQQLEGSAANAQELLEALSIAHPSPEAELVIDKLKSGVDISMGELGVLTQQSAKPKAELLKDLFDTGVVRTKEQLTALGQLTAKPTADLNDGPARNKISGLRSALASLGLSGLNPFSGRAVRKIAGKATGGRLPTTGAGTDRVDGILGVAASGMPIARVDAGEWVINRRSSQKYDRLLAAINEDRVPAGVLPAYADGGVISGSGIAAALFGGFTTGAGVDILGGSQQVLDAEKRLAEARKELAKDSQSASEAERSLEKDRRKLSQTEQEQSEKIAAAEKALGKARESGNAEKIAAAEKKLAEVRESAPEKSKDAAEKISRSEQQVQASREKTAEAARKLAEAEKAIKNARIEAAAEIAQSFIGLAGATASKIGDLFSAYAKGAEFVEKQREEVNRLRRENASHQLDMRRKALAVKRAELDIAKVRKNSAIAATRGEETRMRAGKTGIHALIDAHRRYHTEGVFGIEMIREAEHRSKVVEQEDLQQVEDARRQAAIELLDATEQQELAQLAAAEATMLQAESAELLRLKTQQLAMAAAEFHDMSIGEARGAQKGFEGIGKIFSGAGKVLAGAAAGFLAGGPLGALIGGIGGLLTGGADIARGAIDVHHNKQDISNAWEKMGHGDRAVVVLGAGGALAANALGPLVGAKYGSNLGKQFEGAGEHVLASTIGARGYALESRVEKLQQHQSEMLAAHQKRTEQRQHEFEQKRAERELEFERKRIEILTGTSKISAPDGAKLLDTAAVEDAKRTSEMLVHTKRTETIAAAQLQTMQMISTAVQQRPTPAVNITLPGIAADAYYKGAEISRSLQSRPTAVEYVNSQLI